MNVLRRVCLASTLTALVLGDFAGALSAEQGGALYDPADTAVVAASPSQPADDAAAPWAPRQHKLESVLGREIHTRVEDGAGRIIDLLADNRGEVRAAVIEFGGFLGIGTRKIAVEWSALSFERDGKQPQIILDMTRDQLRQAPEYKPNEPAVVRKAND
jgi:hypothetical protein